MEEKKQQEKMLQWHPAFYAGLQIEFEAEAENLIFENEYQLGTKPKEIDVLVIKKDANIKLHKNIGRIFREHNIIEYKGPTDYLSVGDFYKVYGYACFYKSQSSKQNQVKIEGLTLTYVSHSFPKSVFKHLKNIRKYDVNQVENGIYYVKTDMMPVQFIVTKQLNKQENLWIRSLTNQLEDDGTIEKMIAECKKHKHNVLYDSVLDIVVHANSERVEADERMCEALKELFKDEFGDSIKEMEEKQKNLEQKTREVEEKNREVEEKNREVEERERALREKEERLQELQRQLEEKVNGR